MVESLPQKSTNSINLTLSSVKKELKSALSFAYVLQKLQRAGIITKREMSTSLHFVNQEIQSLVNELADFYGEKGVDTFIFGVGFLESNIKTQTERTFCEIWKSVVQEIDNKWKSAS